MNFLSLMLFLWSVTNPMFPPPPPISHKPLLTHPVQVVSPRGSSIRLVGGVMHGSEPVTTRDGEASIYGNALNVGSLGILAHNSLAGKQFGGIAPGENLRVVNDDGTLQFYKVREVSRYQALTPTSPSSRFVNLSDGSQMSARELAGATYNKQNPLVLQTCIEKDGDINWGRMFVIAEPTKAPPSYRPPM